MPMEILKKRKTCLSSLEEEGERVEVRAEEGTR